MKELTEAETTSAVQIPTASTVMDWMRKFERSGGNPLSLLSGNCFRRTSGRLHPLILEIARRQVRDFYCTRKRPTARATKLLIDRELSVQAARGRIDEAEATISISTLRRVIHEVSPFDRCVARYGPAYARNKWRYSLGGIDAPRVLARYEIDHTILDNAPARAPSKKFRDEWFSTGVSGRSPECLRRARSDLADQDGCRSKIYT